MSTGPITNWLENTLEVGPMYPFAGYEVPMFLVCFILWILYTVWQMRFEHAHYERERRLLGNKENLQHIVEQNSSKK